MPGLTLSQLTAFQNSTLAKMRKTKFTDTLKRNSYAFLEEFVYRGQPTPAGGTQFEARVRLKSNVGATRGVDLFEDTEAQKAPAPVKMIVPLVFKENKGIVYDLREQALNTGEEQVINHLDAERSANFEDIADHLETDLSRTPNNSSDTKSFMGLWTWLRPSMNSSGTFVTDETGGFNGTYIRYRDGTRSSTLAGLDASTVDNERWRNWCATATGDMDKALARRIRNARDRTNFKSLPMLKGEMKTGDAVLFMGQADHEVYKDLVNDGPDDRRGDLMPFDDVTVGGMRIKRAHVLDSDALRPIFGVRLNKFSLLKMKGFWMKEGKPMMRANSHNVAVIPTDIAGNLMTRDPRGCGFVIHRSF